MLEPSEIPNDRYLKADQFLVRVWCKGRTRVLGTCGRGSIPRILTNHLTRGFESNDSRPFRFLRDNFPLTRLY